MRIINDGIVFDDEDFFKFLKIEIYGSDISDLNMVVGDLNSIEFLVFSKIEEGLWDGV